MIEAWLVKTHLPRIRFDWRVGGGCGFLLVVIVSKAVLGVVSCVPSDRWRLEST